MTDIQEQLAQLRQRIAKIDKKFADPKFTTPGFQKPAPRPPNPEKYFVEEWLSGCEVDTGHGCHWETERLYERHRRHGSIGISDLEDLTGSFLHPISNGQIPDSIPRKWAFLDTETTGLAGGAGTYAFLIGVGSITPEGFRVKQFFMREFCEETSQLVALAEYLEQFDVLITYNGITYDQPLLETRYRMSRARPPFARLVHLDLLFGARRLWKLRFDSCRLVDLENQILGVERQGDVPGALIPYVYFDYLRTKQAARLLPVLQHNAMDIVSLACLAGIVPYAFRDPVSVPHGSPLRQGPPLRHGSEMCGIARWLRQAGELDQSRTLFRRAVEAGLADDLLFRTLWDIAALERKLGAGDAALAVWTDLAAARNPYRVRALEELAKHYEHREKNPALALEMTRAALQYGDSPELRKREERLVARTGRVRL